MPQREQIIAWLSDAHAMEQSLTRVLQQHIKDARDAPEMRERLERHLDETRRHAERVRSCLELLGTTPSTMKALAGGAMGMIEGMSTGMFRDERVKNAIADYAMEHFEMGCYSALAAAADDAGFAEIARTCREIFGEEADMADWYEEQIPEIARMHLQQSAAAR
jgi:ferritin-like metal-binding protein YciE